MMRSRQNRALHLQVETEEMYGVFSPDRSRLLTGGDGAHPKVHIWDVETGNCLRVLNGHEEPVAALAWSEDQRSVASGAFDRNVRLWDVASGECFRVLAGHRSYVRSVDFSRSRERLLSGWGELLAPAAFLGRLGFGPSRGSQVTFVRADQWVGHWQDYDPTDALAEICRRYFAAYAPASQQGFAHWFRLKPDEARHVMESLAGELQEVDLAGRRAWMLATDAEEEWEPELGTLSLLPQYDSYILGCVPREWVVPQAAA